MSDLAELEARIRAALERIDAGLDRQGGRGPQDAADLDLLRADLAAEQTRRAEAEAALAEVRAQVETSGLTSLAQGDPDRLLRQVDALSLDNQRLRNSVASLREEVRRLTEALAEGVTDAHLINHALVTELEALRAARASETTEMAEILAELDRIVTEGELAHA